MKVLTNLHLQKKDSNTLNEVHDIMKNRYKVVEVENKHKTVNRADPTLVTKVTSVHVLSYHNTMKQATKKIEKLEEAKHFVYEEMDAYGAPSECYDKIGHSEYYIVDRPTETWYELWENPDTGEVEVSKTLKKVKNDWKM